MEARWVPQAAAGGFEADRRSSEWFGGVPVRDGDRLVGESVELYRPRTLKSDVWEAVGPAARDWVRMVPVTVEAKAVSLLKPLSQYLAWRSQGGMAIEDPRQVFRSDDIELFIATGCAHLAGGTRATYRSALRSIGEHVAGYEVACPDRAVSISKPQPNAPYTSAEVAAVVAACRGRHTAFQRHNAMVLVACGLGAGLTAADMTSLVGTDVETSAQGTVIVHVQGPNPRRIPVLAAWEAEVARLADLVGGQPAFRSARRHIARNDIGRFCERLNWQHAPSLSLHRLRVTWLVGHLDAGTPLHLIADAAGVSATSVARYATFALSLPTSVSDGLLRRDQQT